jgi:hypothetical protein
MSKNSSNVVGQVGGISGFQRILKPLQAEHARTQFEWLSIHSRGNSIALQTLAGITWKSAIISHVS